MEFTPLTLEEVTAVGRVAILAVVVIKVHAEIMPEEVAPVTERKLLLMALM